MTNFYYKAFRPLKFYTLQMGFIIGTDIIKVVPFRICFSSKFLLERDGISNDVYMATVWVWFVLIVLLVFQLCDFLRQVVIQYIHLSHQFYARLKPSCALKN